MSRNRGVTFPYEQRPLGKHMVIADAVVAPSARTGPEIPAMNSPADPVAIGGAIDPHWNQERDPCPRYLPPGSQRQCLCCTTGFVYLPKECAHPSY